MDNGKITFKRNTCETEYKKNSQLKKEDIEHLMSWIEKQQHLPKITEFQMIWYYHCCNYSLQQTKTFTDEHFRFRHDFPEAFIVAECPPPRYLDAIWDIIYLQELPDITPTGYRVLFGGIQDSDPTKWDWYLIVNCFLYTLKATLYEKGTCTGYSIILDMEGFKMGHLSSLSISFVRNVLNYIQEIIPIRIREIHVIRINSLLDKLLFMLKPFMKKELWDMLNFHSDMETFYRVVPKEIISKDYDGLSPYTRCELNEITKARIEAFIDDIEADLLLRTDEEKRPNGGRQRDRCVTASFKKLDID